MGYIFEIYLTSSISKCNIDIRYSSVTFQFIIWIGFLIDFLMPIVFGTGSKLIVFINFSNFSPCTELIWHKYLIHSMCYKFKDLNRFKSSFCYIQCEKEVSHLLSYFIMHWYFILVLIICHGFLKVILHSDRIIKHLICNFQLLPFDILHSS